MKTLPPDGAPRILVRAANWIGDAVMSTPALEALRGRFPGSPVTVLGRPWVLPVFSAHPSVTGVLPLDVRGGARGVVDRFRAAAALRDRAFDLAVILPNSLDSALVPWLARIPERVGYAADGRSGLLTRAVPVPAEKTLRHEIYHYLDLVAALGGDGDGAPVRAAPGGDAPCLSLRVPPEGEAGADRLLAARGVPPSAPLIGFNPGAAYGPAKCWPVERFAELGRRLLAETGAHLLVFGTARERPQAEAICGAVGPRAHDLAGATSLAEAMALVGRLRLFVTNDSGLMHVGAALDVPLVAIFGSTNPVTTGPWSIRSTVIRHELPCSPCLRRSCPGGFECMKGIGVDEVLAACRRRLERDA
ncbi:lipopolysaccharide heptosyltransferase II [Dissulfurirhabdus thermomarina]|uniref:lipopolysaccharide heptosyltransferase II n=1 Tax=Dissulfurirhabdus thermomarina TaxID=1765737 RepID=A0A6N9TK43_DISTH|nr:lipopolysaccharide heptosyltransferase II [Dissulfurirhabdus thermomarina]NDY41631.1 lipopolysaccharide heptosyltransferase II [Dissulfurirhabdus thermomarina]NMX23326.1 lipopolysaccharide heptosyltransferase II [Dissulfurirhabdus thermomarina]